MITTLTSDFSLTQSVDYPKKKKNETMKYENMSA